MAFSKVTGAGVATDTLKAEDIAADAIGTAELANDVSISTSGNIATTGSGTLAVAGASTHTGTSQLTGAVTLGTGGTNWTLPTARGTDGYVLTTTSGTGNWTEIALAPDITAVTWYSDSGYSETLTATEAINKNPAPVTTSGTLGTGGTIRKITSITTTNISIGDTVTGTGIGTSAVVSSVDTSGASNDGTITLSVDNTGSGSQSLTFTSAATPSTYLKISGLNLSSAVSFGSTAYVQIINTSDSNAVVGHNQNSLNGCVVAAQRVSDSELKFTINTNGVSGIVAGNTLKIKIINAGGEELFDIGYTVSADPTSITTVNSATVVNTASVGTFGARSAGGSTESNTKVLLNFDRWGGQDVEDSSNTGGNGFNVGAVGSTPYIKSSPFGDGKSAIYFDGSDDRLVIADSDDFSFAGEFTVEFWAFWLSSATGKGPLVFAGVTQHVDLGFRTQQPLSGSYGGAGKLSFCSSTNDNTVITETLRELNLNQWYHVAVCRDSSNIVSIYIDGIFHASASYTASWNTSSPGFQLGRMYGDYGSGYFHGYLDEIRIVNGIAVYTGNFTVPTSRLSDTWAANPFGGSNTAANSTAGNTKFLFHSNLDTEGGTTFDDSSDSNHTITASPAGAIHSKLHGGIVPAMAWPASGKDTASSGMFFDGDYEYLTILNQNVFNIGTADFTIECWVYYMENAAHDNSFLFDSRSTNADGFFCLITKSTGLIAFGMQDASNAATTTALPENTWTHLAFVRSQTHTSCYFNGKLEGYTANTISGTSVGNLTNGNFYIGTLNNDTDSGEFKGYIDGLRISDSARYTGTSVGTTYFTPPTKVYGQVSSKTINTISLAGTPGDGGGYVTYKIATLSGNTETNQTIPAGLTLNEHYTNDANGQNNTATITGTLTAAAGTHSIPIVARATSDGTDANIDPNRKQDYTHTITVGEASDPVLFNARRYTGSGTEKELTGFGFKPDLIWLKDRTLSGSGAGNHMVQNSLRTYNSVMHTDSSNEYQSNATGVTSFNPDGVTMLGDARLNESNVANIAWGWKAGGAPSAAGKRRTNDSPTETTLSSGTDYSGVSSIKQSVNTAGSFSITIYDGNSSTAWIKHGLHATEKPDFYIVKGVSHAGAWAVWHKDFDDADGSLSQSYLQLNTNDDYESAGTTMWNNSGPSTDGRINFGNSGTANTTGRTYVMYCWKAVADVSYFGWYEGTGSGLNVPTTGFVPRFIMLKNASNNGNWLMLDSFRTTFSGSAWSSDYWISADVTTAEGNTGSANCQARLGFNAAGSAYEGFSVNAANDNHNTSGHKYIYIAFA